jgi:MFS transporter, OFA family, oxalate/formate antiporter
LSADRGEFARGWKVLGAGFLGVMCGASPIPFNVLGALFEPLQAEFGWNRGQISAGITIFGITASLLAPVYGSMADRYGVRKVALWSLVAFAASFAALGLTTASIYSFWALWLVVGLVGIGSTPVTWSRAISLWFVKNRGLALGIMLIGTSVAALFVPRLAVWAIESFGWREMFLIVALLPLLVALPVGLLFFREPRADERPAALTTTTGDVAGMTFAEARRTRQFWILWISILMIAFAYGGAHIHMIPIVRDHGFTLATAASIAGVVGLGILVGRLSVGWLLDRFWGPAVAFPALCLPALACFFLMGTDQNLALISTAAFMLGFAAGAESDLIAYLASRYFGMAHFGRIYGMLYMPFGLASAISPLAYGIVRDRAGSYDPMLIVAAVLFVAGGAILLLMGRYPDDLAKKEALA